MSVLGFDIRDYTDPQRMLEESIRAPFGTVVSPQPPMSPPPQAPAQPPAPQQQPPAPQTAPVTIDQGTGSVVNAPAGINPAAAEQPPAVNIPGIAGPSPVSVGGGSKPATIKPMEGVTNSDRVHAMAMVLGAVGQNNFSNVMGAAQAGLMQKEQTAREYNDALKGLTTPQYAIKDGRLSYVPAQFKVDKDGNYVPRSENAIKEDIAKHLEDSPSLDHPGGATGQREDQFIKSYFAMPEEEQLIRARRMGYDSILTPFDLKQIFAKNSVGLSGAMQSAKTAAQEGTGSVQKDFNQMYKRARYAKDDIAEMQVQLERLKSDPDRGGFFQPLTSKYEEILAEFGNEEAITNATNEQLNRSDAIKRTMKWFADSGLGARGLDTPAEFMVWLEMNGGDLSMTNEATIKFLERAIRNKVRDVNRYNAALDDDVYSDVRGRQNYSRIEGVTNPYAPTDEAPPLPPGFVETGGQP